MSARSAEILREAALILEREGWCQGRAHQPNPDSPSGLSHCAMGAISKASGTGSFLMGGNGWSAFDALSIHIERNIPGWNDTPGRTAADVIKAMREVADVEDFR